MVKLKLSIPENFYCEEVRCNYKITTETKKIWAVELDLLAEVDRVCKKHNIIYYVSSGTVLGAIRHGGFIPWDDDIDIMLLRSEYEKLCSVAYEFKNPYFFQTDYSDPGSLRGHAQLRNSYTTGILKSELEYAKQFKFNQGIFIDIFPLDNVPENVSEYKELFHKLQVERQKMFKYRDYYFHTDFYDKFINPSFGMKRIIKNVYFNISKIGWNKKHYKNKYYREFEKVGEKYNCLQLSKVWTPIFFNCIFDVSVLGKPKYHKFEFLKVPVPENAEEYLTELYGDWHEFIVGSSAHGDVIFDTDISYDSYIESYLKKNNLS